MALIEIDRDPSPRTLRSFGLVWLGFVAAMAAISWLRWRIAPLTATLAVLAIIVPVVGWSWPRFMRTVYVGMSTLAWPIGFVVSHVAMAVVYYLVLTPIGGLLRVFGYDPMERSFDRDRASYWIRREGRQDDVRRYFRQF